VAARRGEPIGYCGLDARREPLTGDEIRPCWEGAAALAGGTSGGPFEVVSVAPPRTDVRPRIEFVEVGTTVGVAPPAAEAAPDLAATAPTARPRGPDWTLFPDLE
jgi:hypothetical protein